MILADSSIWIDHLRDVRSGKTAVLEEAMESRRLILGDLVLFEILRGARDDRHARALEAQMRVFPLHRMVGPGLAVAAAGHARTLRGAGVTTRKSIDLLIATFCVERGYALLHRDRDFDLMARHIGLELA